MTRIKLSSIEMDTSIQCRASIDTATVSEYAERMTEGDEFPPVIVYGTSAKCWIADGWHRIMAAKQVGLLDIAATVTPGGRIDALKAALSANAAHGIRRGNADKRRAVEIALREFPKLSSRMIAEMCGVSNRFVDGLRGTLGTVPNASRITADGREYPATRRTSVTFTPPEQAEDEDEDEGEDQQADKTAITDPLSGRVEAPHIDADEDKASDAPTLAGLKRYWRNASKRERKAFIEWTQTEGAKQ